MNMVGHNDPGVQIVKPKRILAKKERIAHELGDARILQPRWALDRAIQDAVNSDEAAPIATSWVDAQV